jgi:hypothetical protein
MALRRKVKGGCLSRSLAALVEGGWKREKEGNAATHRHSTTREWRLEAAT